MICQLVIMASKSLSYNLSVRLKFGLLSVLDSNAAEEHKLTHTHEHTLMHAITCAHVEIYEHSSNV